MLRKSHPLLVVPGVLATALVGCADTTPVGPTVSPTFGVAGKSGCYTVQFSVAFVPTNFPTFTSALTGDLEGTADLTFDLPFVTHGKAVFGDAQIDWNLTGGIIAEVPLAFRTEGTAKTLFLNDNDPLLLETHDRQKAVDGVRKANLTGHGVTDITGSQVTRLDYHGVICP